ncbi:hypothetical protein ACE6H2_005896 [Prunus campanulata]
MDDEAPRVSLWNTGNITDNSNRLNEVMMETITAFVPVAANAASGAKKFAINSFVVNFTASQELYTLMQCTLDLSSTACDRCLRELLNFFLLVVMGSKEEEFCILVVMLDMNCVDFIQLFLPLLSHCFVLLLSH